jgi:hypothetical protein
MNDKINNMIADIETMKAKLGEEIAKQEDHASYEIKNGYVKFEKEIFARQQENMKSLWQWFTETPLLHLLSSPVVYMMVFPAMLLDVMLFIYAKVVSNIFKFSFPPRKEYVVFDRQYLGYLNSMEKLNCMYCSYFNGLMAYASAIASRTEYYFCPIKHAKKVAYKHEYYDAFLGYGEEEKYQERLKKLREKTLK